jgi:hypothetical protein
MAICTFEKLDITYDDLSENASHNSLGLFWIEIAD